MAAISSTTLRNEAIVPVAERLSGGKLFIFAGAMPLSPDSPLDASQNPLLVELDSDSQSGLHFDLSPANGTVVKDSNEVWAGTIVETGVPSFFRLCEPGDDGIQYGGGMARIQGTVGMGGADLNTTRQTFEAGEDFLINYGSLTQLAGG